MSRLAIIENQQRVPIFELGTTQSITATSSLAVQSAAFGPTTHIVYISVNVSMFIEIGDNPTAVQNSSHFISQHVAPRLVAVSPGQRLSAIARGNTGNIHVTEML